MRLPILLLLAVLLAGLPGGRPAHAQAPGSPPPAVLPASPSLSAPPPAASAPRRAALDTAAVLHHYFARRRRNGHVSLAVGAGVLVVGYAVAAANDRGGYASLTPFLLGALGVVVSLPVIVRGAVLTATNSEGKERRVLQAWQQHRLPDRWARRALVPALAQIGQ